MFVLAFSAIMAQVPVDKDTKLISYKQVVEESGSKDSLYVRAIAWVNSYFKNAQSVTSIRDVENGKIVGTYRFRPVDIDEEGRAVNSLTIISFSFKIEAKENRYRVVIDNFTMKATSRYPLERWLDKTDPTYVPKYDDYLVQLDKYINEMLASIKKGMKPVKVVSDEW